MLNKYIEHIRNRSYMVGIERDRLRVNEPALEYNYMFGEKTKQEKKFNQFFN